MERYHISVVTVCRMWRCVIITTCWYATPYSLVDQVPANIHSSHSSSHMSQYVMFTFLVWTTCWTAVFRFPEKVKIFLSSLQNSSFFLSSPRPDSRGLIQLPSPIPGVPAIERSQVVVGCPPSRLSDLFVICFVVSLIYYEIYRKELQKKQRTGEDSGLLGFVT